MRSWRSTRRSRRVEAQPSYGLVVFVDDATIINNGQPYADAASLQADFIEWSTGEWT